MGSFWLIGAYIPPVSSPWPGWTDVEPIQKLWETIALCSASDAKDVALLADLNGRIGSEQVESFKELFARLSSDPDEKANARGTAILDQCDTHKLVILNGTNLETASPGRYTSFQHNGKSVIDYAIVSANLVPRVRKFHVESPTQNPKDDWSDHTRICLTLDATVLDIEEENAQERGERPDFRGNGPIDDMYQATMDAKQTPDEALEGLWGPIMVESPSVYVYVEGLRSKTSHGGAGIFFGPSSPLNQALAVPGFGTDTATADRSRDKTQDKLISAVPFGTC